MAYQEIHFAHELVSFAKIILDNPTLAIGFLCFTARQREYIRRRDNFKCQHPECSHRTHPKLEIHHIIPQRYAKEIGVNPDFETNGIALCMPCHTRVHSDRKDAGRAYRLDREAYKKIAIDRDRMLREKVIYWNSQWDRQFSTTAIRNSQRFIKNNPHVMFPDVKQHVQKIPQPVDSRYPQRKSP